MRKKFDTPAIVNYPSFMIKNTIKGLNTNKEIQLGKVEELIGSAGKCMNTCNEPIYTRLVILYYYL